MFVELSRRLEISGLRGFVANSIIRAFVGRESQVKGNQDCGKYSWGTVTADEMEFLFLLLCPCLDGLMDKQLALLNASRLVLPGRVVDEVSDPMPSFLIACGRLLTWYSTSMTPSMTRRQIQACKQQGANVMRTLRETFPVRNTCVSKVVANILNPPGVKTARGARSKCESKWGNPKSHAVSDHCNDTNLLIGDICSSSAAVIEMKHLKVKAAAARTNQRTGWELQILLMEQREDDAMSMTWEEEDPDVREGGTTSAELFVPKCRPRGRATFTHDMYCSALQYPVFDAVRQHGLCNRRLNKRMKVPGSQELLNLTTHTLSNQLSASHECADLKHLPLLMARFVCAQYHHLDPRLFPGRGAILEHKQIYALNMLAGRVPHPASDVLEAGSAAATHRKPFKRPRTPKMVRGELAVYNEVVIKHPTIVGEVRHWPWHSWRRAN